MLAAAPHCVPGNPEQGHTVPDGNRDDPEPTARPLTADAVSAGAAAVAAAESNH